MGRGYENLTGKQFGRWIVVSEAEPKYEKDGHKRRFWNCQCTCDNHTERVVSGASLRSGKSTSCGCLRLENAIPAMNKAIKKENTFNIKDGYCEIIDNSGNVGYIDIDDIEKVKERYWYKTTLTKNGNSVSYMYSHVWDTETQKDHKISLHEYLTGQKYIDHINHNGLDNRKCNLRVPSELTDNLLTSNQGYNNINHKLGRNNTSGYKGVFYSNSINKWVANIGMNYKTKHLGQFDTKEEAIEARKRGEQEYYCNWSLEKSNILSKEFEIKGE